MNEACLKSTKLINYILQRLEVSPRTVFRQSDLNKISADQFAILNKHLIEEYRDFRKTTFVDDDGVRRFIRKVKDQYWGYSQDPEILGRIPLSPEDIKYFRFDLNKFAEELQKSNNLSGKVSPITDRILFIGQTNFGQRTAVLLGFFGDDRQAELEFLSLPSRIGSVDRMLVICPTYECSQDLLSRLNHHGIDCATWSVLVDEDGRIQYRSADQPAVPTLKLLNEKKPPRSYWVELNGDRLSIPYAKYLLLLFMVIKLKDGNGWINRTKTDLEGITESSDDANVTHLYHLISELTKYLKQCNDLIENDGAGNYRLAVPLSDISYPSEQWLHDTYGDILSSLDMTRERRKKQKKRRLRIVR